MESSYSYLGPSLEEFSSSIGMAMAANDKSLAMRLFIQLNDNLSSASLFHKLAMCEKDPGSTGSLEYDALIAGLVEYHLRQTEFSIPSWVFGEDRSVDSPWFFEYIAIDQVGIKLSTPSCFAQRNIFIRETELMSV